MLLRAAGVRVRPLGDGWVAHSAISRETHLLNEEAVAVLEALDESVPRSRQQVADALSADYGVGAAELLATLEPMWDGLVASGLVCRPTT
jgi:hypothetical protein